VQVMMEGSLGLAERKTGHMADYAARMIGKALAVRQSERGGR